MIRLRLAASARRVRRTGPGVLVLLVGLLVVPVSSHHSHGNYNMTAYTTLEGVVKEVHWINPHTWIYLEVKDDKGEATVWALEGASVIQVDDGVDTGPILAQERVPVLPGDTESTLHDRIKPVERRLLIQTILDIANGTTDLKGTHAAASATSPHAPRITRSESGLRWARKSAAAAGSGTSNRRSNTRTSSATACGAATQWMMPLTLRPSLVWPPPLAAS